MCMVSVVGTIGADMFKQQGIHHSIASNGVTRAEFEALRQDVEMLKAVLIAAKKVDAETGQADCEREAKVALLRQIAEAVGVSLDEAFGDRHTLVIDDPNATW